MTHCRLLTLVSTRGTYRLPAPGFGVPSDPFNSFVWQRSLAAVVEGDVVAGELVVEPLVVDGVPVLVVVRAAVVVVRAAVAVVLAAVAVVLAAVVPTDGALLSEPQAASAITTVASHASRTAVV
jgi:hypothetical protein